MVEIWKAIETHPDYEVSTLGRIRSYKQGKAGTVLKPGIHKNGYYYVLLYSSSCPRIYRSIHSLIAKTFLGPCPEGHEVDHIDGDRKNNNLDNLEYVTHYENMSRSGVWDKNKSYRSKVYKVVFPEGDVLIISNLKMLADELKIDPRHLYRVAKGRRKQTRGIRISHFGDE